MHDDLTTQLTEELRALDDAGCNWIPVEGAHSVATIVVHLLGGELAPVVRTKRDLLALVAEAGAVPPPTDDADPCELLAQLGSTAQLYREARRRARGDG
jgi:hypothetical protein